MAKHRHHVQPERSSVTMPAPPVAEFVAAAHGADQFPSLGLLEVAIVGRSNVGKSSFLNALTGRRQLARTSRTPGRTRSINFYRLAAMAIVDLPGYGYARIAKEERKRWQSVVESYLQRREVRLVILLVDARVGPTELDRTMLGWLQQRSLRTLVILTKADKLRPNEARTAAARLAASLAIDPAAVATVSARTGAGMALAWQAIGERVR
jgi:GTP-binding protein